MREEVESPVGGWVRRQMQSLDWQLLLFLVLFLNVKIYCKIAAVVLIYILRPDLRFGFRRKGSRLPLFYPGIVLIGLLDWLFYGLYGDLHYTIALADGIFLWALCLLAIHQLKLSVERNHATVLHHTLLVFFVINAAVSFLVLIKIMIVSGTINPYTYQGEFQKYFINTGDYIKGLSFDTSHTNAIINAFGLVYFLSRRKAAMALICMSVLLLTGSNTMNLLMAGVLLWLLFFRSDRDRKSLIVVCLFLMILFLVRISPQNREYMLVQMQTMVTGKAPEGPKPGWDTIPVKDRPDSVLSPEQIKQKIATRYLDSVTYLAWRHKDSIRKSLGLPDPDILPIPQPDINTPKYQWKDDTTPIRRDLTEYADEQGMGPQIEAAGRGSVRLPGKLIALRQTAGFLAQHPGKLLTGNGVGRFSSKLAYRIAAFGLEGRYPVSLRYIDKDFRDLHLALYIYFFTAEVRSHSVMNSPNSVYDQLLGEYGLVGLALFLWLYAGYFIRRGRKLSYGLPLLVVMGGAFFFGYWFEQLSVVVLFELMMLVDMKGGDAEEEVLKSK
jgi:hypothetical protein